VVLPSTAVFFHGTYRGAKSVVPCNTMVYHGDTMLTPRYSMAHHVCWGSSYMHCCRVLIFAIS